VSYLIVDEAEEELEMADDPFLDAGIHIPSDLPAYVNKSSKAMYATSGELIRRGSKGDTALNGVALDSNLLRRVGNSFKLRKTNSNASSKQGQVNKTFLEVPNEEATSSSNDVTEIQLDESVHVEVQQSDGGQTKL